MDSSSSGENGTSRLGLLTLIYLRTVYHIIRAYTSHLMIGTRGIHSKGKCFSTMQLSEWCPMSLTVLFIGNIIIDGRCMSNQYSGHPGWGRWTIDGVGSKGTTKEFGYNLWVPHTMEQRGKMCDPMYRHADIVLRTPGHPITKTYWPTAEECFWSCTHPVQWTSKRYRDREGYSPHYEHR